MNLLDVAESFFSGDSPVLKEIPKELHCSHRKLKDECKYCAANELGEHLRPLRERREKEAAFLAAVAEAKLLKEKPPKRPPKPTCSEEEVCSQWTDNTAKEEIRKLTLKTLYGHSERLVAAKRDIKLSKGLKAKRGDRGHLISVTALRDTLDPFKTILQRSLDKGCIMAVINDIFMVIPEDWVRYPKR